MLAGFITAMSCFMFVHEQHLHVLWKGFNKVSWIFWFSGHISKDKWFILIKIQILFLFIHLFSESTFQWWPFWTVSLFCHKLTYWHTKKKIKEKKKKSWHMYPTMTQIWILQMTNCTHAGYIFSLSLWSVHILKEETEGVGVYIIEMKAALLK